MATSLTTDLDNNLLVSSHYGLKKIILNQLSSLERIVLFIGQKDLEKRGSRYVYISGRKFSLLEEMLSVRLEKKNVSFQ